MKPAQKDITIRFGDVSEIFFRIRKKVWNGTVWVAQEQYQNLTGWSVLCQVREDAESNTILATYTVTFGDQNTSLGRGSVYLKLTPAITGALQRQLTKGVYDIQVTDTVGNVYTLAEGSVTFTKDVSRV